MAKKPSPYRESTSYLGLRLDIPLKNEIEAAAAKEDRSVSNWVARVLAKEIERLNAESS